MTARAAAVLVLAAFALAPFRPAGAADGHLERTAEAHADDEPTANVYAGHEGIDAGPRRYATLGGDPVSGYLARPADGRGPRPALVVIHEWWGLNDNIRATARRLADAGYVALAVDLYEGETATEPERARELMKSATARRERLEDNLRQAFYYLDVMPSTDRIGSIGWCFGGGWSLRTALMFPDELDAAVIYYGELVTDPEMLKPLQVPILGVFGSEDPVVPPSSVEAFDAALTELDKPHEIHVYEDASHAFANPSGDRYEPDAAERAWRETLDFLDRHLRGAED